MNKFKVRPKGLNSVITHIPHTISTERKWDQGYLRFVSIDPGIDYFALRIERRPFEIAIPIPIPSVNSENNMNTNNSENKEPLIKPIKIKLPNQSSRSSGSSILQESQVLNTQSSVTSTTQSKMPKIKIKTPSSSSSSSSSSSNIDVPFIHPVTEYFIVMDFSDYDPDPSATGNNNTYLYSVVNNFLDQFSEYYEQTHCVIVERGFIDNYKMVRMSQHIISYFTIKLKNKPFLPLIFEIDSKLKGKILQAPTKNEKGQKIDIKAWAKRKAVEILTNRGDMVAVNYIKSHRRKNGTLKGDDLADTVIQIEAICILYGWNSNLNV